jgi:membrane protease YdiL (CAAX protease family)
MARVSFAGVKQVGIAILWLLLFGAISVGIIYGLSEAVPGWGGRNWFLARNGVFELVGFGIATLVVGRLLNKRSWDDMGWRPRTAPSFGRGVTLGSAMAIVAVLLAALFGARVRISNEWNVWAAVALPLIVGLVLAALGEELAFRGYPLRRLADATGVFPAILVFAVLFGLAHARNPNATVFSTVNVALAAIWLSFAFFSQGGMGLAWGAHLGWNAALALLYDAPVSGFNFHVPVVEYTPGAHAWIDGGAFGPEGGIVSTIALCVGMLYLLTRRGAFSDQPPAVSNQQQQQHQVAT